MVHFCFLSHAECHWFYLQAAFAIVIWPHSGAPRDREERRTCSSLNAFELISRPAVLNLGNLFDSEQASIHLISIVTNTPSISK
jgi:hypothetical protein